MMPIYAKGLNISTYQ